MFAIVLLFTAVVAFAAPASLAAQTQPSKNEPRLVAVKQIWDAGHHNAFTDLIRYKGRWYCTFREGEAHVGGDGTIRVLESRDCQQWASAALLSETGVDLRDPKLSITPDNRLMLMLGGSVYEGQRLLERQPRVAFSKNGRSWTTPQRVLEKGEWLWRVTWHKGRAYGISYNTSPQPGAKEPDWTVKLVESDDGVSFRVVTRLAIPGKPNEATVRFLKNGDAVALVRREAPGAQAWIGTSKAPYTDWTWAEAGMKIGGPNFLILRGDRMIASGRQYNPAPVKAKTFVGAMSLESVTPELILPSGGDCSYPGMVWHKDTLWLSYYSSHEGRSKIYLAQVKLPKGK